MPRPYTALSLMKTMPSGTSVSVREVHEEIEGFGRWDTVELSLEADTKEQLLDTLKVLKIEIQAMEDSVKVYDYSAAD